MEMKRITLGLALCALAVLTACTTGKTKAAFTANASPLTTKNVDAVKGQKATCAGPAVKTFNLEAIEVNVNLGMGTSFAAWTYNGRIPAPIIEACVGDKIVINMTNKGTTAHG